MKIILLNTWGGRAMQPLMDFVQAWRERVDVFCFQEVRDATQEYCERRFPDSWIRWDLWPKLCEQLSGFRGHFSRFDEQPTRQSLATFVRSNLQHVSSGDVRIFSSGETMQPDGTVIPPRMLHYEILPVARSGQVLVVNYHGLYDPDGKEDTPARWVQSREIRSFLDPFEMPIVFCADLNLEPHAPSLATLSEGIHNLVVECGIKSTRTPLYRGYNMPLRSQFADYILVSPGVRVNEFRVLPDIASDHAALYLDFTL